MAKKDYLSDVLTLGHWDPMAPMQGQRIALAWRGLRFVLRATGHLRNNGDTLMSLDQRIWATKALDNPNADRPYWTIKHEYAARYLLRAKSIFPLKEWLPHTLELLGIPFNLLQAAGSLHVIAPEDEPSAQDLLRFEEELAADLVERIIESEEHSIYETLNLYLGVTYLDYTDLLSVVRQMLKALRPIDPETERIAVLMQLEDAIKAAKDHGDSGAMIRAIDKKMTLLGFSRADKQDVSPHRMVDNTNTAPRKPTQALIEQLKEKRNKNAS